MKKKKKASPLPLKMLTFYRNLQKYTLFIYHIPSKKTDFYRFYRDL